MMTALLLVVSVLLAAGMVFMVVQALRGCFVSTVWVCCGGLETAAGFLAALVAGVIGGLTE